MTKNNEKYLEKYMARTHLFGRVGSLVGILLMLAAPFAMGLSLGALPNLSAFAKGLLQIGIIYIPSCIVEFLIYTPMLGAGGSYLAFLTGNLINMKIPCALNARDIVGTEAGTTENEIVRIRAQRMAEALCHIQHNPPATFLEGVQLMWIYSVSCDLMNYSRMDDYLGQLYADDVDSGRGVAPAAKQTA